MSQTHSNRDSRDGLCCINRRSRAWVGECQSPSICRGYTRSSGNGVFELLRGQTRIGAGYGYSSICCIEISPCKTRDRSVISFG